MIIIFSDSETTMNVIGEIVKTVERGITLPNESVRQTDEVSSSSKYFTVTRSLI